jgi:glutamate racemase
VAQSLADYLRRHPKMESRFMKQGKRAFFTTDDVADFDRHAGIFYGEGVEATHVAL